MIAYSEKELYNCHIRSEARAAFDASEIGKESVDKIEQTYPCKLYTPHFFIAVALGLLTGVVVIFTSFLMWILTSAESASAISWLCLLMVIGCYLFLEWMVKSKNYFNAGVDNMLMVLTVVFAASAFLAHYENLSWILFNGVMTLVALWMCLRFGDAFMAIVSCSFFLSFCFLLFLKSGSGALAWFPFVMMLIIGTLYFFAMKAKERIKFMYEKCASVLTAFLLISFYAAANYWVVREFQLSVLNSPNPVAFGWLLWIFTFLIPVVYIVYGILIKDLLHIRVGLILIAAAIFTYRYYYAFLPIEMAMLLCGVLLIALSYFLIKWLKPARYGYTSEASSAQPAWKNIEALVIAETMRSELNSAPEDTLMAGGSGGGGGASGEF